MRWFGAHRKNSDRKNCQENIWNGAKRKKITGTMEGKEVLLLSKTGIKESNKEKQNALKSGNSPKAFFYIISKLHFW